MLQPLELVNLTEATAPASGLLAHVGGELDSAWHLDEKIAVREASFLTPIPPDYIFFRRFSDGRSSQVAAYVIDNSGGRFSKEDLAALHHNVWLSGNTPLLYVEEQGRVDIYSCSSSAFKGKNKKWDPKPFDAVKLSSKINDLKKAKRFSAFRLADGTFWEDERNARLLNPNSSAHRKLIAEVEHADRELGGANNPASRHLLLLTLLLKYLEDRGVFPDGWFSTFHRDSLSCLHVFKYGGKNAVLGMFRALEEKFNGDIFQITPEHADAIDNALLQKLTGLIWTDLDSQSGQFCLWDIYSFKHIPVEVLSHIYQHFADAGKGAVFTPPMVVNLMLDQVMPLNALTGNETILDPSCGSGIFLVSAFRRLIHVWCDKRGWQRPTPQDLNDLLSKTIFGIELQEQASELASFSLALAICDALQPNVIWKQLKFNKLLKTNIFAGDYCDHIDAAKMKTPEGKGFDIVIGNPPFMSSLTPSMKKKVLQYNYNIPDSQSAYFFLLDCSIRALKKNGRICILQNAGFLYNENVGNFRNTFFSKVFTEGILDFVSVRGIFKGADVKIIAVLAKNCKPETGHFIRHWTFRRTFATDRLVCFELDYYDYHKVSQELALKHHWPWRVNLLGGGRLFYLTKRLAQLPTLEAAIHTRNWNMGEGFIVGKKKAKKEAPWLTGKPFLPTKAFTKDGIDLSKISYISDDQIYFDTVYTEERFSPPLILIKENAELPCTYWDKSPLAYKAKIIGIHSHPREAHLLKKFYERFLHDKRNLKASCFLLGTQLLVGKATVPDKLDICRLPWPENGDWDLASWEEAMLDDVVNYMAEYVRLGQDSLLLRQVTEKELEDYTQFFLQQLQKIFPSLQDAGHDFSDGLMYQAFRFRGTQSVDWLKGDWAQYVRSILFTSHGDAESFSSVRMLRIYHNDTLILLKPDRLRYWMRSTAIRDVDDTLAEMMAGEEQNA